MKRQKTVFFLVALALIAGTGVLLAQMRAHQRLGRPGVKTLPLAGLAEKVLLPERVLDYESKELDVPKMVLDYLPKDTSYGQRMYRAPDGFAVQVNVVLMGSDRTSIHKPEFCLSGQGWRIDQDACSQVSLKLERPRPYDLPVMKLIATQNLEIEGETRTRRGVYLYWFVADDEYTASHTQRMWWMARDMLTRGTLQRWAYITYFAACAPGQEEATFERMKILIAASVPEFQTTPRGEAPGPTAEK
jgi:hypothetical protein